MALVGTKSENHLMKTPGGNEHGEAPTGLGFSGADGPLIAVAGLCGGAGASLFSYLLAVASARESHGRVLLCDLGGPAATISTYAQLESDFSIPQASRYIAAKSRPPGRPFVEAANGLRLICRAPEPAGATPIGGVMKILSDAKRAHALTVLDCGGLQRSVEYACLSIATNVVWVLPATIVGLQRARALLDTLEVGPGCREILLARTDRGARKAPLPSLADLADSRQAPLLLMESVEDPLEAPIEDLIGQTALTLQALAGAVLR